MDVLGNYHALTARIDDFAAAVISRRSDQMQCRAGCDGCCHVELTVSPVEAAAIRRHLLREEPTLPRRAAADDDDRCVMLGDDGRCAIYQARPLVCRTQGLPLRYPAGTIPPEALLGRARAGDDQVTWCPLNFETAEPRPDDVLDAERSDELLALVNRRYCADTGEDPLSRIALAMLAFPT